jgi:integrase
MPLKLYRRHRKECEGGHPEDFKSGEFEEGRRGWKKCGCIIHASGTIAGKFDRKQTGKATWEEAKEVARIWEASSWGGVVPTPESEILMAEAAAPKRTTVEHAVLTFLAEMEEAAAYNTLRKNRFVLNALKSHSDSKGYVHVEQWAQVDVREFRRGWGVAPNTASKYLEIVKAFFEYALDNEWIARNPARKVKDIRGRSSKNEIERIPFSDEELRRMFDACENSYGKQPIRWNRKTHHRQADAGTVASYRYKWTGEDLADFIYIGVYTGLRISDICTFHIDRLLESGECHIRTTKTSRKVYTWIPEWLQDRIRERSNKHGPLIFGAHATQDINVITDIWRRKLKRLWNLCGPWKEKPTPHRLRHTFARILLQKPGVTVRDVAELLGDTEEMVRKHYAAWVPERQERLTRVLKGAFEEKPKPKVIVLPRGRA